VDKEETYFGCMVGVELKRDVAHRGRDRSVFGRHRKVLGEKGGEKRDELRETRLWSEAFTGG
jgi:hypothetical protein